VLLQPPGRRRKYRTPELKIASNKRYRFQKQESEFGGAGVMTNIDGATATDKGPITMDIISPQSPIATIGTPCGRERMNAEIIAKSPLLSSDCKWAIRFSISGLTTIVLGRRDFGDPRLSTHFAQRVVARLGVPFGRIRLYYSATLPAILQTPRPQPTVLSDRNFGSVAAAAVNVIEELCDQVIYRVRQMAIADDEVGFDQTSGRPYRTLDGRVFEFLDVDRDASRAIAVASRAA